MRRPEGSSDACVVAAATAETGSSAITRPMLSDAILARMRRVALAQPQVFGFRAALRRGVVDLHGVPLRSGRSGCRIAPSSTGISESAAGA